MYRNDPDVGVHSAAEWVLRNWGEATRIGKIDDEIRDNERRLAADGANDRRNWYVSAEGHTMAIVRKAPDRPTEFSMGSSEDEASHEVDEILHLRHIDRSFAIATREVTVEQFQRFWRMEMRRDFGHNQMRRCPEDRCPIIGVTWAEAALYCNWLSRQDDIPESQFCYLLTGDKGLQFASDYLQRTGYRLPTEAEWEYACRAGSVTPWSFGSSTELATEYACYIENCREDNGLERTSCVGSLKPNDLGLFDVHGNAWEWCNDRYVSYPVQRKPVVDAEDRQLQISPTAYRVLRGGSFFNVDASALRSAYRFRLTSVFRSYSSGFRPARTSE
jgi:formylglycine-generating enzyme required for sulfatase activity